MEETKECKYPKDIAVAQTTNKTLAVRADLSVPDIAKGDGPLTMYHRASRFVFTIIDISNNSKQFFEAKLKPSEVSGLVFASRSAADAYIKQQTPWVKEQKAVNTEIRHNLKGIRNAWGYIYRFIKDGIVPETPKNTANTNTEVALTYGNVKIAGGKYKGKTPLEVILNDPSENACDGLAQQIAYLEQHLSQYSGNRQQIDAINEVLNLYKAGKLNGMIAKYQKEKENGAENAGNNENRLLLHDSGQRPDMNDEKIVNGRRPVREMRVYWNFDKNYPVEVEIANYMAPVVKQPTGAYNVQKRQMTDYKIGRYNMTCLNWMHFCDRMEKTMDNFEHYHAAEMFRRADAIAIANAKKQRGRPDNVTTG